MPEQTRRTAAKWWGATRNIVPSLTHSSVSQQLRQQGVPHKMLVPLGDGLPTADIAIQPKSGSRSVAVQVKHPELHVMSFRAFLLVSLLYRHLLPGRQSEHGTGSCY